MNKQPTRTFKIYIIYKIKLLKIIIEESAKIVLTMDVFKKKLHDRFLLLHERHGASHLHNFFFLLLFFLGFTNS